MKVKILAIIALVFGTGNLGFVSFMFWEFRGGASWYEPDINRATLEFGVAVFLTLLSLAALILFIRSE